MHWLSTLMRLAYVATLLQIIRIGNQVTDFFDEENNMTQALQSHKFTTAVSAAKLQPVLNSAELTLSFDLG